MSREQKILFYKITLILGIIIFIYTYIKFENNPDDVMLGFVVVASIMLFRYSYWEVDTQWYWRNKGITPISKKAVYPFWRLIIDLVINFYIIFILEIIIFFVLKLGNDNDFLYTTKIFVGIFSGLLLFILPMIRYGKQDKYSWREIRKTVFFIAISVFLLCFSSLLAIR